MTKAAKIIKLNLKAKHFIGTNFFAPCHCAISKAMKEYLTANNIPFDEVTEGVYRTTYLIENNRFSYSHTGYDYQDFDKDLAKALTCTDPETIINTIDLTPII